MPKVTFALPEGAGVGGVTTWAVATARRLVESGRPAAVIEHAAYGATFDLSPGLESINCTDLPPPISPHLREHDLWRYLPRYRAAMPSVVVPNWSHGTYATCAAIAMDEPDALRVIGYAHADGADYYEWLVHYEPIIHLFVAVSTEIADSLAERLPHRARDIVVRPYAVDVPQFLKRSYSHPDEPLRLVYAGRVSAHQKRVFDLVRLARALSSQGVNFQLRIVGSGVDQDALRRKIDRLDPHTRQRVTFEASMPPQQMPEVWTAADVLVLVSAYEGTSIAMLEAMAHGCVPVVTRVSGTSAVIESGENGLTTSVGDTTEMARLIRLLDVDRQRLADLGSSAHRTMRARASWDAYIEWFLKTLDNVWRQSPRTWPVQRPLLPPGLKTITMAEIFNALRGDRDAVHSVLIKSTNRFGLRWLFDYRHLAKRILD